MSEYRRMTNDQFNHVLGLVGDIQDTCSMVPRQWEVELFRLTLPDGTRLEGSFVVECRSMELEQLNESLHSSTPLVVEADELLISEIMQDPASVGPDHLRAPYRTGRYVLEDAQNPRLLSLEEWIPEMSLAIKPTLC